MSEGVLPMVLSDRDQEYYVRGADGVLFTMRGPILWPFEVRWRPDMKADDHRLVRRNDGVLVAIELPAVHASLEEG